MNVAVIVRNNEQWQAFWKKLHVEDIVMITPRGVQMKDETFYYRVSTQAMELLPAFRFDLAILYGCVPERDFMTVLRSRITGDNPKGITWLFDAPFSTVGGPNVP